MNHKRGKKKIVYLDQNWLSEVTKAYLVPPRSSDNEFFAELAKLLLNGVSQGRLACPTSKFHERESQYDRVLDADLRSVAEQFSFGLSFNPSINVSHTQIVDAALNFSGLTSTPKPWWLTPFDRDPDSSTDISLGKGKRPRFFLTDEEFVGESRKTKNEITAPMYHRYKKKRMEEDPSYEEEVAYGLRHFFRESYPVDEETKALIQQAVPHWNSQLSDYHSQQELRLLEIAKICEKGAGFELFLSSEALASAPFLSTRAKLVAADIVHNSSRKPEPSLLADFDIASTVVPYADVFLTENYLAELLRKTRVAEDYGCRVFTMRQKKDALKYLSQL